MLRERLHDVLRSLGDAVRGDDGDAEGLMALVGDPRQRAVLDRVTAVMSLVEGHAEYVMDGVGPDVVPSVTTLRKRFAQRRKGRGPLDRVLRRLLGLEQKMKQYADGRIFVGGVVDLVGMEGFNRVWAGPETLPRIEELTEPGALGGRACTAARPSPPETVAASAMAGPLRRSRRCAAPSGPACPAPRGRCSSPAAGERTPSRSPPRSPSRRRGAGVPRGRGDRRPRPAARLGRPGRATPPSCCAGLGLDPVPSSGSTSAAPAGPRRAARAARYERAGRRRRTGARVALGHTLDDQAETVLLGLGRGSGPRSVAGMVEDRETGGVHWWRPLLGVRRETTRAACAAQGLPVWDDPWNADPAYTRVRLRTEVLPLLEDVLGGGVAPALARTAALLREDLDALDALAAAELARLADGDLPAGRRRPRCPPRCAGACCAAGCARAASPTCRPCTCTPSTRCSSGWRGQGRVDLPGGAGVVRASGRLVLLPPDGRGGDLRTAPRPRGAHP